MELFHFIFRLGVFFAIYGFIWILIELGINLLSTGRKRQLAEIYIIKAVKYFFLVDTTFIICYSDTLKEFSPTSQVVFGGIILLMYFIGKLQQNQNQQLLFQVAAGNNLFKNLGNFNIKAEISVIAFAIFAYTAFYFFPDYASNPLSLWFKETILNIEGTPIFGFIFKIIGFFFLLSMVMKMVNSILFILTGGRGAQRQNRQNPFNDRFDSDQDSQGYSDYEEVDDDRLD